MIQEVRVCRKSGLRSSAGGNRIAPRVFAAEVSVARAEIAVLSPVITVESNLTLTPRELDVLALQAEGASNKAIARTLGISVHTVKFHIAALFDKLDAEGRTEAVAQAARIGAIKF